MATTTATAFDVETANSTSTTSAINTTTRFLVRNRKFKFFLGWGITFVFAFLAFTGVMNFIRWNSKPLVQLESIQVIGPDPLGPKSDISVSFSLYNANSVALKYYNFVTSLSYNGTTITNNQSSSPFTQHSGARDHVDAEFGMIFSFGLFRFIEIRVMLSAYYRVAGLFVGEFSRGVNFECGARVTQDLRNAKLFTAYIDFCERY